MLFAGKSPEAVSRGEGKTQLVERIRRLQNGLEMNVEIQLIRKTSSPAASFAAVGEGRGREGRCDLVL